MLDYDQRKKLAGTWDDYSKPQDKANFNKNMRRKMKLWLKELPDMISILDGLPPKVIKNANLLEDLPNLVKFMDTFLEKANPMPVGMHESNEMRNFWNCARKLSEDELAAIEPESSAAEMITVVGDEKYFLDVFSWTASQGDIKQSELLRKHFNKIQKYTNPNVIATSRIRPDLEAFTEIQKEVVRSLGAGSFEGKTILQNANMPTIPPSKPQILIE